MKDGTYELAGKRVIITGASRGLGQACAEAFAREGARLLLTARSSARLTKIKESLPNSAQHSVYGGDLTQPEEIGNLGRAAEEFGDIDVILHTMGGGLGMRDPLLAWDEFYYCLP